MKKLLCLLLAIVFCFSLTACGGNQAVTESESDGAENVVGETKDPETVELSYYEEYETLPTADSSADADYTGKTSKITGDQEGMVVYRYVGKNNVDAAQLIANYVAVVEEHGFATNGTVDAEVSIIDKEIIIAAITEVDGEMNLTIYPEKLRVSSQVKTIAIGDTITTDAYEFTLKKVEFTYELLPKNTSSAYTSYPADSGKVYIHVAADVKNTMQRDIRVEELFNVSAVYDGKYNYSGFTIVDDNNSFDWVGSYVAARPLETCGAHGLIECPAEVDTSKKPVSVTLLLGNTNYEYTLK